MIQPHVFSSPTSFLHLILVSLLSFASSEPNGFSLNLIHRDSPESPLYPGILSDSEKINRIVGFSKTRAEYLGLSSNFISNFNSDVLRFHLSQDFTTYLVKLNLGVPGIPLYLSPDTGSNLVWVQCEPCTHKYRQIPPIYNSSASLTYRKIHCEDPFCRNNAPFFKCIKNECIYQQHYLSGAQTQGVVSREVFESPNTEQITINFGCSRDNRNFSFFERTGKSGGVMGLNSSPISLLQQLSNITHRRFSYCLIPFHAGSTQTSLLRFGNDIPTSGRRFQSTPFVSTPHSNNYYLNLQDISIAGQQLKIPRNTFAKKRDGTGGCIIDSGSSITHLISTAYRLVVNAFENYFDRHGFRRVHLPRVDLELCYNNSHASHNLPSMTFHFEGADFTVEPQFLIALVNDGHSFCVGLLPENHISIIGALNQGNTRFIYDVGAGRLQFSSENCLNDN